MSIKKKKKVIKFRKGTLKTLYKCKKKKKKKKKDCTMPRIQRPGNVPANDQVNGEKTRIIMKAAMTTLNQLQYVLQCSA